MIQHQDGGDHDEVALLDGDVAGGRQDDEIAPAKERREAATRPILFEARTAHPT